MTSVQIQLVGATSAQLKKQAVIFSRVTDKFKPDGVENSL